MPVPDAVIGPIWGGFTDYLLMFLGALGNLGLGRLVLRSRDPLRNLMVGLCLTGGVGAVLAWIAAGAVLPTIQAMVAIGGIALVVEAVQKRASLPRLADLKGFAGPGVVFILLAGILLFGLHWQYYRYSSGDVVYFAAFYELFLADYLEPLRVPTYYPFPSTSTHLAPITALAAICAFIPKATMIHGIEARFLIVVAVIAGTGCRLWRASGSPNLALFVLVMAAALFIFMTETFTALAGSSYLYLLLVWEIAALALGAEDVDDLDTRARAILFFVAIMVIAKLVIAYVPVLMGLYLFWRLPAQRFKLIVWIGGILVAASLVETILLPRPFAELNLGFSLANPFSARPTIDYYMKFEDGLLSKAHFGKYVTYDYQIGAFLMFFLALLKTYLVPLAAIRRVASGRTGTAGVLVQGIELYLLVVLMGWIAVRNSDHGLTHQAWLLFLAAGIGWPALQLAAFKGGRIWLVGILAMAAVYGVFGHSPYGAIWARWQSGGAGLFGGLDYKVLISLPAREVLTRRGQEPEDEVSVRAALTGRRLLASEVPITYNGSYAQFIVLPHGR